MRSPSFLRMIMIQTLRAIAVLGGAMSVAQTVFAAAALTLNCVPGSPPPAFQMPFTAFCTASGGQPPYQFSLQTQSPWVHQVNTTTAAVTLSGIPDVTGAYFFVVTVQDNASTDHATATHLFNGLIDTPIVVSTTSLHFTYQTGDPAPAPQTFGVTSLNPPGGVPVSPSLLGGGNYNCSWLTLTPPIGTTPVTFTATAAPSTLNPGLYSCPINFGPGNMQVMAYLNVASAPQPTLSVFPSSMSFTYQQGGPLPIPQTLSVTSNGTPINFTAQACCGAFLMVSPGNGTTPGNVTVTVNPVGFPYGPTFPGTITLTPSGTGGSPVVIPIKVFITAAPMIITSTGLSTGMVGQPYSMTLQATGGVLPYNWLEFNDVPGLTLSTNGILSGVPTSSGTFTTTIGVFDNYGNNASKIMQIQIGSSNSPVITSKALPTGSLGNSYFGAISVTGGSGNYVSMTVSNLPPGLVGQGCCSVIGTPTGPGNYLPVFQVTDSAGSTSDPVAVPLAILPPAPTGLTAMAADGHVSLSWQAAAGAQSYNIYFYGIAPPGAPTPGATKIPSVQPPYIVPNLTNGVTYYFSVTAVGNSAESHASTAVTVTPASGSGGAAEIPVILGFDSLPAFVERSGTIKVNVSGAWTRLEWTFTPTLGSLSSGSSARPFSAAVSGGGYSTPSDSLSLGLGPLPLTLGPQQVTVVVYNGQTASQPFSANFTLVSSDLAGVRVHPSPWRSDLHGANPITFDSLPAGSTIKIFTVSGHWVKTISNAAGHADWNLKNDNGDDVASGLYLYLVTDSQGGKAHGKFGVIR